MAAIRSLFATHRHALMVLLGCALLVRALVPAGWMPVAGAHGIAIAPCAGRASESAASPASHAMAGMHPASQPEHHPSPPDHPCAFVGLALALDLPTLSMPMHAVPTHTAAPVAYARVAIGRGLAAPPPPQTGPPPH